MGKVRGILVGAVLLVALLALPAAGQAAKQKPGKQLGGIYNQRYCEIFTVYPGDPDGFLVNIFNTIGLNDCPPTSSMHSTSRRSRKVKARCFRYRTDHAAG